MADTDQERALRELAQEAQELGTGYGPAPIVVYVYRYEDGRTQVRAPDVSDTSLVVDMLTDALRAMRDGSPVITN